MTDSIRYAGYPTALVFDKPATTGAKVKKQLLWGDWVSLTGPEQGAFVPVHARGVDGFMRKSELQTERLLELVFVDVGQGDGCLIVTPDDRMLVIDAGAGDNMSRFLRWRFADFKQSMRFEAAILSHSDLDHYGGFENLFAQANLTFANVYTNGLMERAGSDTDALGKRVKKGSEQYITTLVTNSAELDAFLADAAASKGKKYPTMLRKARDAKKFTNFAMLSADSGHVPGFGPGNTGEIVMEVLGPVTETVSGKPALRWFGDVGKTKNGHSVCVRLLYRDITIFAGGDLNTASESLLLAHHAGGNAPVPKDEAARLALAAKARAHLGADFAKACHHGSADVSAAFLTAIQPLGTVISSGDDESYSHPRADTLGLIGKCSRGERPTIFSTELARSASERIKQPAALRAELDEVVASLAKPMSAAERKKVDTQIAELKAALDRSIAVYGAINLRTDGKRAVIAQKIESPRDARSAWDAYCFEPDAQGVLEYAPDAD